MKLSIIVPAFNEEAYLPSMLDSVQSAEAHLLARAKVDVDLIVVDNNSADETAATALERGARVVREPMQGVARARNAGARHADGDVLVFIDADVIAPPELLGEIRAAMRDPACVGGAVDVDYRPQRFSMKLYLRAWRILARILGMAQGATQFCRRCVFEQVGGYDENAWIGEDTDFYAGLKKFAKVRGAQVRFIRRPRVQPSCRRFDKWPIWKVLIWTNPLVIALLRRRKSVWAGWYSHPVR